MTHLRSIKKLPSSEDLIREVPLARALESYPNPEEIPERNMALLRDMGLEVMKRRLAACRV